MTDFLDSLAATPVEPTPARHRGRVFVILGAVVALAAAVVWFATSRSGSDGTDTAPWGPAAAEAVAIVDGTLDAFNSGDIEKFGSYFREDGIFTEPYPASQGPGIVGRDEIVRVMTGLHQLGARYQRVGPVAQQGNTVAFAVSCPSCPGFAGELDVIEFDEDMMIVHYWTILG